jgi:hypothetical protein
LKHLITSFRVRDMTEAIGVNATETETEEIIAENPTEKENVGEVDHLVTIDPEESTTIPIHRAAHTETAKGRSGIPIPIPIPIAAMSPLNGTVIEVHEEETAIDLRAGTCLRIVEVVAAIATGIKTAG